jgi:hypothetical protein
VRVASPQRALEPSVGMAVRRHREHMFAHSLRRTWCVSAVR